MLGHANVRALEIIYILRMNVVDKLYEIPIWPFFKLLRIIYFVPEKILIINVIFFILDQFIVDQNNKLIRIIAN